ncbi:N-succinylarginine dihydrolase [Legionella waltersii]|uniref:N-succinylarginine dihydrolase n=1 Tax=Legionella waltersii TaxID=66969 RepID=A0A0W1ALS6_9GAMM|nr:N-succinylarginine dihydrolase [Legionella waltersii]KTD82238.1 succinylarginine dihydrolase [Legionella waltersii]SNV04569.1 succinylarginine dihydrolase [Legionella waltersii]
MKVYELNIDGLVGSTHHYAGLSEGNIASTTNAASISNPQAAALQGLDKMRTLHKLGLKQALMPPQQRPNLQLLHQLGFSGTPIQQINRAFKSAPEILSAVYSASSMWAANAATVSASTDTTDNRVHFTAANLVSNLHRSQEAEFSRHLLQTIFSDQTYFAHHLVLPRTTTMGDEGAANHNRFCKDHSSPGVNLFVYGKQVFAGKGSSPTPSKYPARQTKESFEAIVRNHLLDPNQVIFACQNPDAIDQGVFHNDVISVANEYVFLVHELAFHNQAEVYAELKKKAPFELRIIEVPEERVSIKDAVDTYLFNSQLITLPDKNSMILIAPMECQTNYNVKTYIDEMIADPTNPVSEIRYLDLKQSMKNGGGPACLRLRIPLNERELISMHSGVLFSNDLFNTLEVWIKKYYRTELIINDLADPHFMNETLEALDQLTQILKLGSIYPFQN